MKYVAFGQVATLGFLGVCLLIDEDSDLIRFKTWLVFGWLLLSSAYMIYKDIKGEL